MQIWIKILFILYLLVFVPPLFVSAENSVQIQYSIAHHTKGIEGAEFSLKKILHYKDGKYIWIDEKQKSNISWKTMIHSPKESAQYLLKHLDGNPDYYQTTDQDGRIDFQGLSDGLWLLYQSGKKGSALAFSTALPVLVQLPQWVGNVYQNDIIIYPKIVTASQEEEMREEAIKQPAADMKNTDEIKSMGVKTGDQKKVIEMLITLFAASTSALILILKKRGGE